jgi:transposase
MSNSLDIFEENRRLREELTQERRFRKEWREKCLKLEAELRDVKAILNRILNPNTPSSQIPDTEKERISPNRNPTGSRPRGKPKNGNGGTRKPPTNIDRKINAMRDKCTKCESQNLYHFDTEQVPIWDLPIIKLIVTLFYIFIYKCKDCGEIVRGTHPELPQEGMIGPNLAAFLTEIRHNFAGSYEKLSIFLKDLTGETFSGQAIKDCIKRTASTLMPKYEEIRDKLSGESLLHSDETRWPIEGKRHYLWLLHSLKYIFITINKSRGRRVITDILGDYFAGVIISDCLKVYRSFAAAFQKCWSHLLRKTFYLKEKNPKSDVHKLHRQLTELYDEAEKYRVKELTESERIWSGIRLIQKLQRITYYDWKSEESKGIIKNWLKEYEGQWLVGVFMPDVEFTNNKDERGIRKVIPTRKMLGGHRTQEGANDFAIIETNRQTWKLNDRSPYKELVDYLNEENQRAVV